MSADLESIAHDLSDSFEEIMEGTSVDGYTWTIEDNWEVDFSGKIDENYDWIKEEWSEDRTEEKDIEALSHAELEGDPNYPGLMPETIEAYLVHKVGDGIAEELFGGSTIFFAAETYEGHGMEQLVLKIACRQGSNTFEDMREDLEKTYWPDERRLSPNKKFVEYRWNLS